MTASPEAVALSIAAAEAASDKLAEDIVAIDVSEKLVITDVFVLCSAANERQVKSVVDAVEERLHAMGSKPLRREGEAEGRWVLLDFGDIVVHVQLSEERIHYAIERLWKDCPVIELPDAVNQGRRRVEARDGE
ncbi:MAG: ribosome-associated protein [Actinomycetota bacterium]|nr:ribosome-associated protein [Actinomycetota bacterium]